MRLTVMRCWEIIPRLCRRVPRDRSIRNEKRGSGRCFCGICDGFRLNQADGAELEKALKLAKESDVIVVAAGGSSSRFGGAVFDGNGAVSKESGSLSMDCGEGMDSAMCHIPAAQEELILELSKLGKPLVVLLIAGRPYCIEEIEKASDAVLYSFYPGPMGGKALADLVYGNCCPSGDCRPLFRVMSDSFLSITTPGLLPLRPIGIWKACLSTPSARA